MQSGRRLSTQLRTRLVLFILLFTALVIMYLLHWSWITIIAVLAVLCLLILAARTLVIRRRGHSHRRHHYR